MAQETLLLKKNSFPDWLVEAGIMTLIVFTPLSIGAVDEWAAAVMEIVVFLTFGIYLVSSLLDGKKIVVPGFLIFYFIFTLIVLAQIVALPQTLLKAISPQTSMMYETFGVHDGLWKTISINPDATKGELLKLLAYAAAFIVIVNFYDTKEKITRLLRLIIIMGASIAVFAVIQRYTWNGKLFWFYPVNVKIGLEYIWGPYINHNHFAGYMELAIPLAFAFLFYTLSRIRTLPGIGLKRRIARFLESKEVFSITLQTVSVFIMSGVLFMSLSRGGITGLTVGFGFFALLAGIRKSLRKITGVLVVVGLLFFAFFLYSSWDRIEGRFAEIGEQGKIKRFDVWRDSVNIVKDFPALGTGLGTFRDIYTKYQTKSERLFFAHAENEYIEIVTDTGIIGLVSILGMVISYFYCVIKKWLQRGSWFAKWVAIGGVSSLVAIIIHNVSDFNMRIPANALLTVIVAAVVYCAVFNVRERNITDE